MDLNLSEPIFLEELGNRVRELRERAELSSAEVAKRLLMYRGNIQELKLGRPIHPFTCTTVPISAY